MNNRQAALITAATLWPEAYRAQRLATFTSRETLDAIYERTAEIKDWLDRQDAADAAQPKRTPEEQRQWSMLNPEG